MSLLVPTLSPSRRHVMRRVKKTGLPKLQIIETRILPDVSELLQRHRSKLWQGRLTLMSAFSSRNFIQLFRNELPLATVSESPTTQRWRFGRVIATIKQSVARSMSVVQAALCMQHPVETMTTDIYWSKTKSNVHDRNWTYRSISSSRQGSRLLFPRCF
jgi:hypothetical protein